MDRLQEIEYELLKYTNYKDLFKSYFYLLDGDDTRDFIKHFKSYFDIDEACIIKTSEDLLERCEAEGLYNEITSYFSSDETLDNLERIARDWNVDIDEEKNEVQR